MTKFVIWNRADDEAFRTAYLAVVGEEIQESPAEAGDSYMVGSSRITAEQFEELQGAFPDASMLDEYPEEFLPTEEP